MSMYRLVVPIQAVGASLVYFDLFSVAGSGQEMTLDALIPLVSGAVAVTGIVGVDLFLTRTTAVGTGGTAATAEGTSLTAATITAHDCSPSISLAAVSARLTPTGGATAGAVISMRSVSTEETGAGSYTEVYDMVRVGNAAIPGLLVPNGTGIRVVQGGVASVGNIGFGVFFSMRQR